VSLNNGSGHKTLLQGAAGGGNLDIVNYLIDAGADFNVCPATEEGRTALLVKGKCDR
jgi:ankyrin repeat protein